MFTYAEMAEVACQIRGKSTPKAMRHFAQAARHHMALRLIHPLPKEADEGPLSERLYSRREFAKAFLLYSLVGFGCDKNLMSVVVTSLEGHSVVQPGKRRFDIALEDIQAGKKVFLCIAADFEEAACYWPSVKDNGDFAREGDEGFRVWETAPNGPLIDLPLHTMLAPILALEEIENGRD